MTMAWFAVLVLGSAAITFVRPWLGFALLWLVLPLDIPMEIGITVYTTEAVLSGVLIGSMAAFGRGKNMGQVNWQPLIWGIPFLLIVAASIGFSQAWSAGLKQEMRWMQLILAVWYAANAFDHERDMEKGFAVLITTAAVASLYGLLKSFLLHLQPGQLTLYEGDVVRVNSTFGHSNQFGGYLVCVLPIAVAGIMRAKNQWIKIGSAIAAGLMGTAVIFTYTRSLWIAVMVAGAGWGCLRLTKRKIMGAGILLIVLAGAFAVVAAHPGNPGHRIFERVVSIFQPGQEDSVSFRMICTQTAWDMAKHNPWFGFGPGNYGTHIARYFGQDYYAWDAINKHIHNLYLQILIETGSLGLLAFLAFLAAAWVRLGRYFWQNRKHAMMPWVEAILAGSIAFLLANLFDVLTIYGRGIHFALILGAGLAAVKIDMNYSAEEINAE